MSTKNEAFIFRKDLLENYSKFDAKYFVNKYSKKIGTIYTAASKLSIANKKKSTIKENKEEIIEMYRKGIGISEIKKKYGHDFYDVKELLEKSGVKLKTINEVRSIYSYDKTFFKNINTDEKAYWLGFIYADGNLCNGALQIALAEKDLSHVESFLKSIKSNHKVYKDRFSFRIGIKVQELYQDLLNLGLTPKKSLNLKFPSLKIVPEHLVGSFVRGYFDGDGSISISDKKKSWGLNIVSTLSFLKKIRIYFIKYAQVNKTRFTLEKRTGQGKVYYYALGGGFSTNKSKARIQGIYDFLYKNAGCCLERKKEKFEYAINYEKNFIKI